MTNFNRRAWARLGAATVALVAAGAMVGLAGPAYAEDPVKPDLSVKVEGANITLDSPGKLVRIDVQNNSDNVAATGVTISFTVDSAEGVTIDPPSPGPNPGDCSVSGDITSCPMDDLGPGETFNDFIVFVLRTHGAPVGPAGKFTVTVAAAEGDANEADNSASVPVSIVDAGIDLVAWAADLRNVAPGTTELLDWAVSNESDTPAASTTVEFALPHFVTFASSFTGCDVNEDRSAASCETEGISNEDGYLTLDVPVVVSAASPGPINLGRGSITVAGHGPDPALAKATKRGKDLKATAKPANAVSSEDDKVGGDNTVAFAITTGPTTIDLAVTAAPASGKVGDVVGVKATFTNNGPAAGGVGIKIKAPSGTVVLNTPAGDPPDCWTGAEPDQDFDFVEASEITCTAEGEVLPGATSDFTFQFKIQSSPVGGDGTIEVFDEIGTQESNLANNKAAIVITITTVGGGTLPITGVQVGVIGVVGVGVVALGGVLLMLSRRRRVVIVAPGDEASTE